ncbi:MAG: DUF2892 domain-containing protein [Candidatus Altiarchaeota archaeon]|nr:DUF2892 domain-containing protein [Candidatus Altiarchaeota archaeon]
MDPKKLFLDENVGGFDLLIRVVLGAAAIIALAMDAAPYPWDLPLAAVAFIGLFSGMTRHCTPYVLLGISTAERKS